MSDVNCATINLLWLHMFVNIAQMCHCSFILRPVFWIGRVVLVTWIFELR